MSALNDNMTALDAAIARAGGIGSLAKKLSEIWRPTSRFQLHHWRNKGIVQAEAVLYIEYLTGVSRHELRPDLYPKSKRIWMEKSFDSPFSW